MTTEYSGFQIGEFVAPLTSSTTNSLLADADPALFQTLAFVAAMLELYLGARFDAEVARAGVVAAGGGSLAGKIAAQALPFDPLPRLQQAQITPPFLAIFPVEESFKERTRNWPHVIGQWKLLYVLPPLTPAQQMQFGPILRAIAKTIFDRLEQGHDPAYASDAQFCALGGIEQLSITRARYGSIPLLQTQTYFPCLEMELEVQERKMGAAAAQTPFAGFDASAQTTAPDGTDGYDLVDFTVNTP